MMCKTNNSTMMVSKGGNISSPISVVDISAALQIIDGENNSCRLDDLNVPSLQINFPPPMDSITATTHSSDDDDTDSLSTGILEEEIEEGCGSAMMNKRSIFLSYWEKTGESPVKPQSPMASLRLRRQKEATKTDEDMATTTNTEEEDASSASSCCNSTSCSRRSSPISPRTRRRSIFGSNPLTLDSSTRSLPTLAMSSEFVEEVIRSRSASMLERSSQPLTSCLRMHRQARRRSSSVSFDDKIDVIIFQKPQVQFAEMGWEQRFS